MQDLVIRPIAVIRTDFLQKFGIPRQSGLVPGLTGRIVFEPAFRDPQALRGIESFSHLWLLFDFSLAHRAEWSPTVRPPRLGGNTRVGVFASRSPFRPNPIGLSCVKLEGIEHSQTEGDVLIVSGVDLLDGTPILDIKPYLPYADRRDDAVGGYTDDHAFSHLKVDCPAHLLALLPEDKRQPLLDCLAEDPRPSYQDDARDYVMSFAGCDVRFQGDGDTLTVKDVLQIK